MKLIIDIPKGEYDKICKTMLHTSSGNPNFYFESKIANGTPLDDIRSEIERMDTLVTKYEVLRLIEEYTEGSKKITWR